jgi:tetratricopeptide (TPR) repeat protein
MKTFKSLTLFLIFTFLITPLSFAQNESSANEEFLSLKQELSTAVDSVNRDEIARIGYAMERFFEDDQLAKFARYYAGYAWYRLYTMPTEDGSEAKDQWLDNSVKHLEKAVEIDPKFAEAQALLGSGYGMKAAGFFSGMKYGPKSDAALEKAMSLSPENPRVFMIKGTGEIYKPSMFGGGLDNAMNSLTKAAEYFDTFTPASQLHPNWGHAEVYAWIGQVFTKQENYEKAKQAYGKALEIDPDYAWVKHELLPALAQK